MTEETPPPPESTPELTEARAEAAAIRRRWITLGEVVAVAGLIIGGLTFWNSWSERQDAAADRIAERAQSQAEKRRVGLIATDAGGDGIGFRAINCTLQSADIRFPKALGVAPQSTVLDHRIEAAWFAEKLLKLTDGGPDRRSGRIPVVIASSCEAPEGTRRETALYDIVWRIEPRLLLGRKVELRGMIARGDVTGDGQARVDALWKGP